MATPGRSDGRGACGSVDGFADAALPGIDCVSAVTLATHDMARALRFYRALGFRVHRGGDEASFTALRAGSVHLNLISDGTEGLQWSWWGRLILRVPDVDAFHRHLLVQGLKPDFAPRDAAWRERYFHITDPDGHELSFVHPLPPDVRAVLPQANAASAAPDAVDDSHPG